MGKFSNAGRNFAESARAGAPTDGVFSDLNRAADFVQTQISKFHHRHMTGAVAIKDKSGSTHLLQLAHVDESEGGTHRHVERKLFKKLNEWVDGGRSLTNAKFIFTLRKSPCKSCKKFIQTNCYDFARKANSSGDFEFSFVFDDWYIKGDEHYLSEEEAREEYMNVMIESIENFRSGKIPSVKILIRHRGELAGIGNQFERVAFKYAFSKA